MNTLHTRKYLTLFQTQIMEDLGEAIESAEKEFHELNHR